MLSNIIGVNDLTHDVKFESTPQLLRDIATAMEDGTLNSVKLAIIAKKDATTKQNDVGMLVISTVSTAQTNHMAYVSNTSFETTRPEHSEEIYDVLWNALVNKAIYDERLNSVTFQLEDRDLSISEAVRLDEDSLW